MRLSFIFKPLIPVVAVIGLLAAFWWMLPQRERPPRPQIDQRVKDWAYVARSKQITPTEELSLVVVPSEFGEPLDVKCFIYKNREFNQATMVCPGISQDDIRVPEQ